MDNFKKILEVLNDLIRINKDREAGYTKASRELTPAEHNLRGIFERKAQESRNNVIQLQNKTEEILQLQSSEEEDLQPENNSISGRIYNIWQEIKHFFNTEENPSDVSSCMNGEITAERCYENALSDYGLPQDVMQLLEEQKKTLAASQKEMKSLIQP